MTTEQIQTALKQLYNIYFPSAECLASPPPTISEKRGRIKENTVNSDGVIIDVYD